MIELASIAELDQALDEEGFWGRDDVVADVYLSYGLSRALRRTREPVPAEPCRLPPAAVAIRKPGSDPGQTPGYRIGEWERSWSDAGYAAAIEAVRRSIERGDVYQVNLVQHLSAPFEGDPRGLATALAPLRPLHPDPLVGDGWTIVSGSPELFLSRRGRRVWTCPIKGTRPLGESIEGAKDLAEHVMIVDLERNDLSIVC